MTISKRTRVVPAILAAALLAGGCESPFQSSQSWMKSLGPEIKAFADKTCRARGGTANVMLATDRQDDGMVTCKDGSNHLFDL